MAEYYKHGETNCGKVRDPFKNGVWRRYLQETKDNPAMKKSLIGDDICGDKIIQYPPWYVFNVPHGSCRCGGGDCCCSCC